MTDTGYPFPFVDRGVWDMSVFVKDYHIVLWFGQPVPASRREAITAARPEPFQGWVTWGSPRVLTITGGSTFEEEVWRCYTQDVPDREEDEVAYEEALEDYELGVEAVQAFYRDIDRWLTRVDLEDPIIVAAAGRRGENDAWQNWSVDQLSARVHGRMLNYFRQHARPASDAAAREVNSEERMLASLLLQVAEPDSGAFDAAEPSHAQLAQLVRAALGYSPYTDSGLKNYLRLSARSS